LTTLFHQLLLRDSRLGRSSECNSLGVLW
jgi:hypothetical protein